MASVVGTVHTIPPRGGDGTSWKDHLILAGGAIKPCWQNVIIMLRMHPEWCGLLAADTFARRMVVRQPSPIGHAAGAEWTQEDDVELGLWLAQQAGFCVTSVDHIRTAVQHVAAAAPFSPPHEWLSRLRWDDVERVDIWVSQYLGAADTPYSRRVGRYFLLNLARRIYSPGCIMRSVMVLEGPENIGKSTAFRILADPWFADTPFRVGDKDAYMQIQGNLIYEIAELDSFSRAEASAVKAFISSRYDIFRAPYESGVGKHLRMTVFGASTNAVEYLRDWSGNTRFWPLTCGRIDLEGLAAVRDQLMAEAVSLVLQEERAYPTAAEDAEIFQPERDARTTVHPWVEVIDRWLRDSFGERHEVTAHQVMTDALKLDMSRISPQGSESQRVGQALAYLGWRKVRTKRADGSREWVWRKPAGCDIPETGA